MQNPFSLFFGGGAWPRAALPLLLATALCLSGLPGISHAADIYVGGGGGGGGGGGEGALRTSFGGLSGVGGGGGYGDSAASGSGNAGGGGGGGNVGSTLPSINGGNASGTTPGTGGAAGGSGSAGSDGAANNATMGGNGGNGGGASLTTSASTADKIVVAGGQGGRGGGGGTNAGANGGDGGNGGNASLTINNTIAVTDTVFVTGGDGGDGAPTSAGSGATGNGGTGGSATLAVLGLAANAVSMQSGGAGATDGYGSLNMGSGGTASLMVTGTLSAGEIRFIKSTANMAANIATLDIGNGDTTLALSDTVAGTASTAAGDNGVYIGTAKLGNGTFTITNIFNPGAALINVLELTGSGRFDDSVNSVTVGSLTLNGGTLNNANWTEIVDHAYTSPDITLGAGGGTVNLATGQDKTLSRALIGTGGLTKTGAGTLTLSGTNTYSGMTTVESGTLALGGSSFDSKDLTLFGGATFNRGAVAHTLNTGSLTVNGANGQSAIYTGDLSATSSTLNFITPVTASGPLLNVSGTADISNSVVNVGVTGGAAPGSSTYTLLQSTGALTAPGITKGSGIVGISRVYTYELEATSNALLAHMENKQSDAAVRKSPAEAKAASVALMTQGADLAAGAGMSNAKAATGGNKSGATGAGLGVAGFGAMSGGASRYNTGSHVDVNSLSLMAGLAKTWQAPGVDILGGVFFEAGWGSYNSYNSLEGDGDFKGKGNSRYYGGGLLGRVDATEGALRGAYAEASLRVGGLHTDYRSDILPGSNNNERGSYDASATYYGAHLGLGYVWELNERASLDLYGKYFWNHTTGMDVTIQGSEVNMKAVNSHRTRFGGRFNYAVNEYITPYIGAAWEHEFDGTARSVVAGESAPAPSLKGGTGLGELGLTWKPAQGSALSVDFGVTGYVGMREGVSGNVQLKFEF